MKKLLIALAILVVQYTAEAQISTPQQSPKATIVQNVGLTEVEVVYFRPSVKERTVFGNLVPFGKLWRTGANENTVISFSDDVVIDGKTLKKGKYALYTIPNIRSWEVIFYSATDNWGTPKVFNEANVALRTTVKEEALQKPVETFTIGFNNIDTNYANLEIYWEYSYVSLKFEVPTRAKTMASIEKALAGPSAADYYASAQYFYQSNGDITKARSYIDSALEMSQSKPFFYLRLKSLIQARQGDKQGAIATAKLSLVAAEAAGNQDYVQMNKESINEWSK